MEIKERILEGTRELFFMYGIRSVTMDDIAKHLSVSKKTIYECFHDKDDIVTQLIVQSIEVNMNELKSIEKKSKDAVQEMIFIMKYISEMFSKINPNLIYDLQKYHLSAWKVFQSFKQDTMLKLFSENLNKGIKQGFYRENIKVEILSQLRVEEVSLAMNPLAFSPEKYSLTEVQVSLLDHFLHGITTLKGHKHLNKYKNINEEE